jgi:hypothetical protein
MTKVLSVDNPCIVCSGELIRGDESTLICLDCGDVFTMDEEGNILNDSMYEVEK